MDTIVKKHWPEDPTCLNWLKSSRRLNMKLKNGQKNSFGVHTTNWPKTQQKLNTLRKKLLEDPASYRLNSWINWLLRQREKMMLFNQKYWGKLSRNELLINGDRNSKIFQRIANARRKQKSIIKIRDECRVWVTDQINIVQKFIADYSQRFKSQNSYSRSLPHLGLSPQINGMTTHNSFGYQI